MITEFFEIEINDASVIGETQTVSGVSALAFPNAKINSSNMENRYFMFLLSGDKSK
jgi:hypothetical protein